jgi:hypothetical protein
MLYFYAKSFGYTYAYTYAYAYFYTFYHTYAARIILYALYSLELFE